jgi:hypothetical protein
MDAVLMSELLMRSVDEERLMGEVESLKASLATEVERVAQLASENVRMRVALGQASVSLKETGVLCSRADQIRQERDMLKRQLDDQLQFRRAPLEAQLANANRILFEQRLQFRGIVDALASQRNWVREWAVQCKENQRLHDLLSKREAGTEVVELRDQLLDTSAKMAGLMLSFRQREVAYTVLESNARALALENERLVAESRLLSEQNKRLWGRAESKSASPVPP